MTTTKSSSTSSKASAKKQTNSKATLSPKPTTILSAMRMKLAQNKLHSTKITSSAQQATTFMIETPNQKDILFGRGGESNNAEGNRRYQKVIESRCQAYSALGGRKAKTQLAWQIYKELRDEGARFLKKEKGSLYWSEAPEGDCRKKISQRLRERALEAKAQRSDLNGKTSPSDDDTIVTTEEESRAFDFFLDEASMDMLPETDFSESDDSIETLMDFADDFPASWTVEAAVEPSIENKPQLIVSSAADVQVPQTWPHICLSAPLVAPNSVGSCHNLYMGTLNGLYGC